MKHIFANLSKIIITFFLGFVGLGISAAVNLNLESLIIVDSDHIYQGDTVTVMVIMNNNSPDSSAPGSVIPAGLFSCSVGSEIVFVSQAMENPVINPFSQLQFTISLSTLGTQALGNTSLVCATSVIPGWSNMVSTMTALYVVLPRPQGRFDDVLDQVRDPLSIKLDGPIAEKGIGGVKTLFFRLVDTVAIPLSVFIAVFIAIITLYKIMFSEDEKALSRIKDIVTRGIVGILIIMSAKFIGSNFFNNVMGTGELGPTAFNAVDIISKLYDGILRPLLKVIFYIMMGVLFIILLLRVFSFVTATEEEIKKRSLQIIISTIVGMFLIMGSKQLVEGVYGKEELIRNGGAVTVTQLGVPFLSDANIPIIYHIIQWIMGLAGLAILMLILFYTYQVLMNPNSNEQYSKLRQYLFYALIGMLIIGAGYILVNVLIIN